VSSRRAIPRISRSSILSLHQSVMRTARASDPGVSGAPLREPKRSLFSEGRPQAVSVIAGNPEGLAQSRRNAIEREIRGISPKRKKRVRRSRTTKILGRFKAGLDLEIKLVVLGAILALGGGGRGSNSGSPPLLQDAQKELEGLIKQLESENAASRERAERSLVDLVARIGKDGLRWLRDREGRATDPEVKPRLRSVLRLLLEPRVRSTSIAGGRGAGKGGARQSQC
jgi:hypothetical protein